MDSATQQMLATIRKRRSALDQMEQLILAEFGESGNSPSAGEPTGAVKRSSTRRSPNGTSRKHQMHAWLKKNGPSDRKTLVEGTGFPDGTIGSYLSTETELFEKRDGKWHAR